MIKLFKVVMSRDVEDYLLPIIHSGYIGEGDEVVQFEKELAETLGVPSPYHVATTNSCTSAIHLSLLALGVGPGDEVITTAMTCTATNSPIVLLGARPVWADVHSITGNIDVDKIPKLITPRTKAIIAVDWTGRSCDYMGLRKLGIPIIQDAAHGPILVNYKNSVLTGDLICLSFGPIKHLTCGDGGAIILNANGPRPHHLWSEIRLLRWYGLDRTSSNDFRCSQDIKKVGGKFHMNNINAAIGRANLIHLKSLVKKHQENAQYIYTNLSPYSFVYKPPFDPNSNYWVFPLIIYGDARDEFKKYMIENGVETTQVHTRNDKHTGFNYPAPNMPGLESFDLRQINIPCGSWLSKEDCDHIIRTVNNWRPK